MASLNKVQQATRYAEAHMAIKDYALIIVKPYCNLNFEEQCGVKELLNVATLPTKAFYAQVNITVGRKDYLKLATGATADEAVRQCFAQAIAEAANKPALFDRLIKFAEKFVDGLETL